MNEKKKIVDFENVIACLEAEIDSLKDAYRNSDSENKKSFYSERILECKDAIKLLKSYILAFEILEDLNGE